MLYGRKALYGGASPYEPSDLRMGICPIEITGLLRLNEERWYLLGEHFSPYCQVSADGRELETEYITPWLLVLSEDPETTDLEAFTIQVVDKHNEILSDTE